MPTDRPDDRGAENKDRPQVSALARTALSRLRKAPASDPIPPGPVRRLVASALARAPFDPAVTLLAFERDGIPRDQIIDRYIPEAAREIGRRWTDDSLSFAEVSIVAAKLQGMLTYLTNPWPSGMENLPDLEVLMVLQQGETHTLGPHVAMAQMRRHGVSVRLLTGGDESRVVQALDQADFDLVMFSSSRTSDLTSISQTAKRIRETTPHPAPAIVLGGLVLGLADDFEEVEGIDLATNDIATALKLGDPDERRTRGSMAQPR